MCRWGNTGEARRVCPCRANGSTSRRHNTQRRVNRAAHKEAVAWATSLGAPADLQAALAALPPAKAIRAATQAGWAGPTCTPLTAHALNLTHHAAPGFVHDPTRSYTQPNAADGSWHPKPAGFWVSHGNAWQQWADHNHYATGTAQHHIELADDANILVIQGAQQFDAFHAKYAVAPPATPGTLASHHTPDWQRLAAEYDGIIITPYLWARRMSPDWYYPWDVASGCIWRSTAIKTATPNSGGA